MVRPKNSDTNRPKVLTPVELEIMNVLWELKEATVKQVQGALPKERALAYTSVATMMKILEQKGILRSEKSDRAHLFYPEVSREAYAELSLNQLTDSVFQRSPTLLVKQLLEREDLSSQELEEIRSLIEDRLR